MSRAFASEDSGLRATRTGTDGVAQTFSWDQTGGLPLLLSDGRASYMYDAAGLPIEQITGGAAGTPLFHHHDELGSTRMLTNSTGAIVGTFPIRERTAFDRNGRPVGERDPKPHRQLTAEEYSLCTRSVAQLQFNTVDLRDSLADVAETGPSAGPRRSFRHTSGPAEQARGAITQARGRKLGRAESRSCQAELVGAG